MEFPKQFFEKIVESVSSKMPSGLMQCREDFEKNLKSALQGLFSKMDLVTREEFDVQAALLAKCQARIEQLEGQLTELEKNLSIER
jgi:BMFP domain-containing protein YqiC